jgi:hypothetical protein
MKSEFLEAKQGGISDYKLFKNMSPDSNDQVAILKNETRIKDEK